MYLGHGAEPVLARQPRGNEISSGQSSPVLGSSVLILARGKACARDRARRIQIWGNARNPSMDYEWDQSWLSATRGPIRLGA